MDILFKVSSLTGSKDVDLRIWDLSGRLVNAWSERRPNVSGAYTVEWKGEAVSGQVLPPGIYILEISVDVDSGSGAGTATRRVLQVAY
jgi:flagellar hook assembly protein FlgD